MRYLGSKAQIGGQLAQFFEGLQGSSTYIEPFVGSCGMLQHVEHPNRFGYDVNPYLIAFWRQVMVDASVLPGEVSEELYKEVKSSVGSSKFPDWLTAFVGFGCSFGGKWFAGYARGLDHNFLPRNYAGEAKRSTIKKVKKLQKFPVSLHVQSYELIEVPENSFVYCDPPYTGTTGYGGAPDFKTSNFWMWCRNLPKGCKVYVSEFDAPEDFELVHSLGRDSLLSVGKSSKKHVEKLFRRVEV